MTTELLPPGYKYGLVTKMNLDLGRLVPVATLPLDVDNRSSVQQVTDAQAYYTDSVLVRRPFDSDRWEVACDSARTNVMELSERELTVLDLRDYLRGLERRRPPIAWRAEHDAYFRAGQVLADHDAEIARIKTLLAEYEQASP